MLPTFGPFDPTELLTLANRSDRFGSAHTAEERALWDLAELAAAETTATTWDSEDPAGACCEFHHVSINARPVGSGLVADDSNGYCRLCGKPRPTDLNFNLNTTCYC